MRFGVVGFDDRERGEEVEKDSREGEDWVENLERDLIE